jgi:hypothetical protein
MPSLLGQPCKLSPIILPLDENRETTLNYLNNHYLIHIKVIITLFLILYKILCWFNLC